jgi:hypothetical protein
MELLAGHFQAYVGIDAESKSLLLAGKAIFPTPIFPASSADLQIEPATVG